MRVPASAAPPECAKERLSSRRARAAARKKASYFQAQYHRLRARRGDKKAIGAVAASILTTAYHMLKYGTLYEDLAPITSTNEAKASMSTASSTASRTSDSPSKSPLWRLPPDVLTKLQPSYWTRRSSHGPPDGGPAGAVPPAGFVLATTTSGGWMAFCGRSHSNIELGRARASKAISRPSTRAPAGVEGGRAGQTFSILIEVYP